MAKNNINISVGLDIKNLKKGFDDAIKLTQGASKDTGKAADQMATNVVNAFKKIETSSSLKTASRQMFNLVAALENGGTATQKTFRDSVKEAGHLQDRIQDLNALIKVGGPAGPFIAMNNALKVGVGAMNAVQGAMALVGADSKELQATMVKLQAGMAFAQGLKELEGLQDVMTQLNFVMKANPMIAVAAGFTALMGVVIGLSSAETEAEKAISNLTKANEEAYNSTIKEKSSLEQLLSIYNDKNTTDSERLNIQKQIVSQYPEYLGQISTEHVEQNKVNSAVTSYIKLLELKAKAQAFQEMYVEALKEERKITKEAEKTRASASVSPMSALLRNAGALTNEDDIKKAQKNVSDLKNEWDNLTAAAWRAENAQKKAFGEPPPSGTTSSRISKAGSNKPFKSPNAPLKFDNPDDLFKINIEQPLEENAAHWYNWATSVEEANKKAADATKQAAEDMSKAIAGKLNDTLTSLGDKMTSTMQNSEDAMTRFEGGLANTALKLISMALSNSLANAIVGATAAGAATGPAAPFTTPMFIAEAVGGIFAAFAAIPKFEQGGIVGGTSFSGDRVHAMVNSGEMILNARQQHNLWQLANSGGGGGYIASTKIDGRDIYLVYEKAKKDLGRS